MVEPTRFVNKKRLSYLKNNDELEEKDPKVRACQSLDLDDLLQFSAARQRALERSAQIEFEQPFKSFVPHRVFINHVDSFNGKVLADYLSEQTISIPKTELSEEDEEEFDGEGGNPELSEERTEESSREKKSKFRQNFEIIGTADFMKNPNYIRPESINEILDEEKKEAFLTKLLSCGFIIYDITSTLNCHPFQIEEATWILNRIISQLEDVQKHAPKLFKKCRDVRTFVLISTLLTWSKTKPIDPDDPSLPLTERDYRKRKPHPNYKIHCEFEKRVLEAGKKFPENLKTIVIGSGITYGREEDVLHFLFKMAWSNAPELPVFRPGNNKIPLIHVNALANIVYLVLENFPETVRYIIAVEQIPITLKKTVKLISRKLGNGKIVKVSKEEAFIYPDIKQRNFDMLTVNLNIIPGYIINSMELTFSSELTFRENIDAIIEEFKSSRNILPLKVFIHGPPASGKTLLSKRLASYYQFHHLHAQRVIEEGIQELKDRIQEIKEKNEPKEKRRDVDEFEQDIEEEEEDEDDEDEDDLEEMEDIKTLTQMLNEIEENMASSEKNRLDEQYVLRLFKKRMLSNPCQNQGFIIDGYPKTIEDTKILYEPEDDVEEIPDEEENALLDVSKLYNKRIMPDFVISLDASDDYLIQKVIRMPQKLVQNTHYVEEEMCRRLVEYRTMNSEDNTPLIFYDELEIYPMVYNVEEFDGDPDLNGLFQNIIQRIGPVRNYGPSLHDEEVLKEQERMKEKYQEQIKLKSQQMLQERREKMEHWMFLKNEEKEMEEKALALLAMPLRHYLMKYIFPTLTRGLVEVARVRPQDPVDYLAEFLFKENPEGKMFEPNYEDLEDELASAMKEYEMSLDAHDRTSEEILGKSYSVEGSAVPDAVSNVTDVRAKCSETSTSSGTKLTKLESETVDEMESSASCKCDLSKKSLQKSSSESDWSAPSPVDHTLCTCPPYPASSSSSSAASGSVSEKSSHELIPDCRCIR